MFGLSVNHHHEIQFPGYPPHWYVSCFLLFHLFITFVACQTLLPLFLLPPLFLSPLFLAAWVPRLVLHHLSFPSLHPQLPSPTQNNNNFPPSASLYSSALLTIPHLNHHFNHKTYLVGPCGVPSQTMLPSTLPLDALPKTQASSSCLHPSHQHALSFPTSSVKPLTNRPLPPALHCQQ